MNWSWLWWVGVALVLGIVEMITVDLLFLMLAGGALAGAIVGAAGAPFGIQLLVAAVVAVLLVFLVRPWALVKLKASTPEARTNTAANVGRKVVVVTEVTPRSGGRVKLAGEIWSAKSAAPGQVVPVDSYARVIRIEGATAIVEPYTIADPSQPYSADPTQTPISGPVPPVRSHPAYGSAPSGYGQPQTPYGAQPGQYENPATPQPPQPQYPETNPPHEER